MKKSFALLFLLACIKIVSGQSVQSPSEFLGYPLGEKFTPHYRVTEYFKHLSSASKNIRLQEYGRTYEGRPLFVTFVSSPENINQLHVIQTNNLRLTGIENGTASTTQPAIVWFSYNIHGNESASTEAAMQTIFNLADPRNLKTQAWLKNTLVIIDPCANPDGRERYVNFYNSSSNAKPDPSPFSREHVEPWPGGRTNHYYFDLNRDWAWQSQIESQQRMALFNKWLPQVHVDFHEQGINEPYFFAPAAEPLHEDITPWQKQFQKIIGNNNARYFDENGWLYFTKERFDLLYPSYADTYSTYNGAIGMTFEQGGSGRAGLAVLTKSGDTLTLKDRISHHYTAGLSTIEATSANASKLISEFQNYFAKSKTNPSGPYKAYVIKSDNPERLQSLATLLDGNGIEYGYGSLKGGNGLNYFKAKNESFVIGRNDMVVSAYQPKSVLVKVLFEPKTFVSDSVTYDITAWALPYAYGLKAYASKQSIKPAYNTLDRQVAPVLLQRPVAFVVNWETVGDVKFLAELFKNGIKVRFSESSFEIGKRLFNAGSLIITRAGNDKPGVAFDAVIQRIAQESRISLYSVSSGLIEKGADLGSDRIKLLKKPNVALVGGEDTSPMAFGEIWHFFEHQINYPVSLLRSQDIKHIDLNGLDVLIFPSGNYEDIASEKIQNWIQNGGKLIALENAVAQLAGKKGFTLSLKEEAKTPKENDTYLHLRKYEDRERESIRQSIPGAIYRINLDNTHPLAYGFPDYYYSLKMDSKIYNFLDTGWNVGVLRKNNHVAGFVGSHTKKSLADGLLFGVQEIGRGSVVYLTEDPLFRGFWENGKLLFSNAIFMVGN